MTLNTKNKGISLPLVIGMLTVLMISAVSINALIIRALQSAQRIEASSKAYMAAEAGLEDALYELSPHLAGYKTSGRKSRFNTEACTLTDNSAKKWCNEWEIISYPADSDCSVEVCGKLRADQKLMIYFYEDVSGANPGENKPGENKINSGQQNIASITPGNFTITFRIPDGTLGTDEILQIDNDRDWDPIVPTKGINEDGPDEKGNCNPNDPIAETEDFDCDNQIDEDNSKDPVILWKLTDGTGRSFIPMPGCLEDFSVTGSEICEEDFNNCNFNNSDACSVALDYQALGKDQNGTEMTINDFLDPNQFSVGNEIQFEFLIIAPLEHISLANGRIDIPYIEYEVDLQSDNQKSNPIPSPYFTIKSDGYYGNFKQSLSTRVLPKTTVPLFDFTIIQQE